MSGLAEQVALLKARSQRVTFTLWAAAIIYGLRALSLAGDIVQLAAPAGYLSSAVILVAVPLFLAWFHSAVGAAQAAGGDVRVSPKMAVLSWLMPIVNAVWPFLIVRRLLFKSNSGVVLAWWLFWILGIVATTCEFLLAVARSRPLEADLESRLASVQWGFGLGGNAVLMLAAGLGALLVAKITGLLTSRIIGENPAAIWPQLQHLD